MPTALIVDDEPLARTHLRRLLEQQGVEVVGEAENAPQALEIAENLTPDLLFLDIQLRGLTGMQAASAFLGLDTPPLLIFVTGYSEYAAAAFEQDTLDYIVKPASPERLVKTLARARARLADSRQRQRANESLVEKLNDTPPLQRLPIRKDYSVLLVRIEDILYALARDKRVLVHTNDGEYRTYYTLSLLETLLPPDRFFRIHDSCLVRLDAITEVVSLGSRSYLVLLANGTQLPVSRARYLDLQRRLGLDILPAS